MKPLFDHFAEATDRPLYALDWIGFGLSDRPPVDYRPELYQRQLRRFLSECLHEPADVVALSLACEYAAAVAAEAPLLIHRLALLAPTNLGSSTGPPLLVQGLIEASDRAGLFEVVYDRLTRAASLRSFYERQTFRDPAAVPAELVTYAEVTTKARGAHFAPARFVAGDLFMHEQAWLAYTRLSVPTLMLTPEDADGLVQGFDRLPELLRQNVDVRAHQLPGGLLPQWEAPAPLFAALDSFLL